MVIGRLSLAQQISDSLPTFSAMTGAIPPHNSTGSGSITVTMEPQVMHCIDDHILVAISY